MSTLIPVISEATVYFFIWVMYPRTNHEALTIPFISNFNAMRDGKFCKNEGIFSYIYNAYMIIITCSQLIYIKSLSRE